GSHPPGPERGGPERRRWRWDPPPTPASGSARGDRPARAVPPRRRLLRRGGAVGPQRRHLPGPAARRRAQPDRRDRRHPPPPGRRVRPLRRLDAGLHRGGHRLDVQRDGQHVAGDRRRPPDRPPDRGDQRLPRHGPGHELADDHARHAVRAARPRLRLDQPDPGRRRERLLRVHRVLPGGDRPYPPTGDHRPRPDRARLAVRHPDRVRPQHLRDRRQPDGGPRLRHPGPAQHVPPLRPLRHDGGDRGRPGGLANRDGLLRRGGPRVRADRDRLHRPRRGQPLRRRREPPQRDARRPDPGDGGQGTPPDGRPHDAAVGRDRDRHAAGGLPARGAAADARREPAAQQGV
ncbi:MAG: Ribose ABC transport system, permease protein RbsC, partial [uncultured Thermomicrobiales bacterium]